MNLPVSSLKTALCNPKLQVMNFLNEIAQKYPSAISFAPGRPVESYFEVARSVEYLKDFVDYASSGGAHATVNIDSMLGQYGRTNGLIGDLISQLLANDEAISVSAGDIVATVGCQEAMCLCLLALCGNPGDVALVADPAYIGITGTAHLLGIEVAPVSSGAEGLDIAALLATIDRIKVDGKRPRILYLSPDFSNPTGATMPAGRRNELLDIARGAGFLILEDHAYNYFQLDGERLRPLKSEPDSDHVLYLGSFSKSIYPGLRLGFIATTAQVVHPDGAISSLADELSKVKSLLTVNTSPISQGIVGGLLVRHGCSLQSFVIPRREALRRQRDAMLEALARHFPKSVTSFRDVHWNSPAGGFFLQLSLPYDVTDEDLTCSARDYGVLWTPMSYFFENFAPSREIRLSFSYVEPKEVDAGIAALARMVRARMENTLVRAA